MILNKEMVRKLNKSQIKETNKVKPQYDLQHLIIQWQVESINRAFQCRYEPVSDYYSNVNCICAGKDYLIQMRITKPATNVGNTRQVHRMHFYTCIEYKHTCLYT